MSHTQIEAGVLMWPVDRSQLEWAVRQRVRAVDNIEVVPGRKAVDLVWNDDQTVGGVTVETDAGEEDWPAGLVVTIQKAAGGNPELYRTLTRMMHMKQTPSALLRPGHLFNIASTGLRDIWR
jgi:hypothetical protein